MPERQTPAYLPISADGEVQSPPFAPDAPPQWVPKRRIGLHIALFLATVATTSLMVSPVYSACLMAILTAHEFGHYFAARYHRVPATLPYFIPAPLLIGTMGAVIRMSPHMPNRKALFDIGAAGPIAGIVLAVPISFVGLSMSTLESVEEHGFGLMLGDPLLFQFFQSLLFGDVPEGTVVVLHDAAFAGWVGLLVTAMNLLPIGQLDGGHIAYAGFGRYSVIWGWLAVAALAAICVLVGYQYVVFLALLLFMRVRHPPTLDDSLRIGTVRNIIAVLMIIVLALCFTATPFVLEPPPASSSDSVGTASWVDGPRQYELPAPAGRSVGPSIDREDGLADNLAVSQVADPLRG